MTHLILVRTAQLKDGAISGELAELVDSIRVGETFDVRPLAWAEDTVSHGGGLVELASHEELPVLELRDKLEKCEGVCLLELPVETDPETDHVVAALETVGLVRK